MATSLVSDRRVQRLALPRPIPRADIDGQDRPRSFDSSHTAPCRVVPPRRILCAESGIRSRRLRFAELWIRIRRSRSRLAQWPSSCDCFAVSPALIRADSTLRSSRCWSVVALWLRSRRNQRLYLRASPRGLELFRQGAGSLPPATAMLAISSPRADNSVRWPVPMLDACARRRSVAPGRAGITFGSPAAAPGPRRIRVGAPARSGGAASATRRDPPPRGGRPAFAGMQIALRRGRAHTSVHDFADFDSQIAKCLPRWRARARRQHYASGFSPMCPGDQALGEDHGGRRLARSKACPIERPLVRDESRTRGLHVHRCARQATVCVSAS